MATTLFFVLALLVSEGAPPQDKKGGDATQIPEEVLKQANVREAVVAVWVFGCAILAVMVILVGAQIFVMLRTGKSWDDPSSTRIVSLTMVLGLGVFVTMAGYSPNQAAPIYGLMGAVLGYMFGKDTVASKIEPIHERTSSSGE